MTTVDFAAVGRVSKHAEIKEVRLVEVAAKSELEMLAGSLKPEVRHDTSIKQISADSMEIVADYEFSGSLGEKKVVVITMKYVLIYGLKPASEPLTETDIAEFAKANGTLHSWPFVRETLHGLTYRMGLPPFNLGVMHFAPKPTQKTAGDKNEGGIAETEISKT
jgi:preprotein translocase subunit SecB